MVEKSSDDLTFELETKKKQLKEREQNLLKQDEYIKSHSKKLRDEIIKENQ